MQLAESKNEKQVRLAEVENKIRLLEPFKNLPLNLELYHDYQSLDVLVGNVRSVGAFGSRLGTAQATG